MNGWADSDGGVASILCYERGAHTETHKETQQHEHTQVSPWHHTSQSVKGLMTVWIRGRLCVCVCVCVCLLPYFLTDQYCYKLDLRAFPLHFHDEMGWWLLVQYARIHTQYIWYKCARCVFLQIRTSIKAVTNDYSYYWLIWQLLRWLIINSLDYEMSEYYEKCH